MTYNELMELVKVGSIIELHTAYTRGYMSRKQDHTAPEPYNGKFGRGYTVERPARNTNNYHYITYYIYA